MLMFPPEYSPLDLPPGYVWNFKTLKLYSYKSGVLKELSIHKAWRGAPNPKRWKPHYVVSHLGKRKVIEISRLLTAKEDYTSNVVKEKV